MDYLGFCFFLNEKNSHCTFYLFIVTILQDDTLTPSINVHGHLRTEENYVTIATVRRYDRKCVNLNLVNINASLIKHFDQSELRTHCIVYLCI